MLGSLISAGKEGYVFWRQVLNKGKDLLLKQHDRSIWTLFRRPQYLSISSFGRGRNCAGDFREVNYRKVSVKAFMLLLMLL